GDDNHFKQPLEIDALLGGDFDHHGVAAPAFPEQATVSKFLLDAVGVGVGLIDLVDGDDDGHFGGPGVVNRFNRLRHDAVVSGDDEHDHVGDFGAAGAHHREG